MKIKSGFVLEKVADSYLACATGAIAADFHALIRLNDTGAFLWNQLRDEDLSRDELLSRMLDEYDVSHEVALCDIDSFLTKLKENKILDE